MTEIDEMLRRVRNDLKNNSDQSTKQGAQRYFKEPITVYGVKTGVVNTIAKRYLPEVKRLHKQELFTLCEALYASDVMEEAFVASIWLPRFVQTFEKQDLWTFKHWLDRYINNWAKCDGFCNHTLGDFVEKYPETVQELKRWTMSPNRWVRRAAAVTLIVPAKHGKYLKDAFAIADNLLEDSDDIVQKGYGWLLKEESRAHQHEVFEYILSHRDVMPRTALRYAIELMPQDLRRQAMEKRKKEE